MIKLPKECLKCDLWRVGKYNTKDFGRILCYDTCPYRKDAKGGIQKWILNGTK